MTERILALCRAMGASESQEELLLPLVQAAREQLAGRLREDVDLEDCGPAFPLAAAMAAMGRLAGMTDAGGSGGVTSFTAGELSVRRESGSQTAKGLMKQAEELLAPWLRETGFAFQGVEG